MQPVSWTCVVLAVLLLALPALAQRPPPLPWVDLGNEELRYGLKLISKRTDEDVWALGGSGASMKVLRSADAGRSWRVDAQVSKALADVLDTRGWNDPSILVWFSPQIGLAAGSLGSRVLRTADGGMSWRSIPLAEDLFVYDVERLGSRAWLCGSSGHIFRSDDAGASWRRLKGSPFDGDDRCMDMSFLNPEKGWAVGMNGSVWATEDGGENWQRLSSPELSPFTDLGGEHPGELRHVVRLAPQVAWVQGSGGRFLTEDGGRSWTAKPKAAGEDSAALSVARTEDGRRVVSVGPLEEKAPEGLWIPLMANDGDVVSVGEDTAVVLRESELFTYALGQLVRAGPPVRKGAGALTPLEGIARKNPRAWLGWAGTQVVSSHDEGQTWFRVGRVPEQTLRAFVFLKGNAVLAESGQGSLLRSNDFGRSWAPTAEPVDGYDFAVLSGRRPVPASPFACVLTTSPASLTVHFGILGCFSPPMGMLSVSMSPDGAEFSGTLPSRRPGVPETLTFGPRGYSREEGERLIRALWEDAIFQETQIDCGSTAAHTVIIEWSCPSGPIQEGKMSLLSSVCSPFGHEGYARARGVHDTALEALKATASP
ncbi:Uncharacterized protein SAMN05444354_109161 [Stigmatella aurantiaca]|uniref:Uncharacterized protein n=2 Tax=Stigmatella aurantiaca TaxID=41 RepID=A0A1H7TU79_STIAU|nr:Uncharacterized protein SAMN05444354_109161 [Stigmatella aurantiaca]